jgi:glycosyltransferase involved in cell wall biosynthesis
VEIKLRYGDEISRSRFPLILEVMGINDSKYEEGITIFAEDSSLDANFRAAVLFLTIRGRYPNDQQIDELATLLKGSNVGDAITVLLRKSSLRDRKRLLVPAEGNLIDVTRYSRTSEMSGIPRVVRSLITSASSKGSSYGVWSDQVFGPVQVTKDGFVYFHKKVWGSLRSTHYLYFYIRKFFFSSTTKLSRLKFMSPFLKGLRGMLFGRFLLKMVDIHAPRACFIINPRNLVIPEVPDAVNSDLLRVWIQNTQPKKVRCIVHDLLPLTHPEYFPNHAFGEHENYVKLLRECDTLIVGTPVLADELANRLNISKPNSQIKILPLPIALKSKNVQSIQPSPILTFIGGYQARKGLKGLVDFLDSHTDAEIKFVVIVVGAPNVMSGHDEAQLYLRLRKRPSVYQIYDTLEDTKFADLIASSSAVLYISTAEGYGLPVLESLSLSTPVIAARTPVNEHFSAEYGGIHFLSDPYSVDDLVALNNIATGGPLRDKLKAAIKSDRLPTDVEKWAKDVLSI